MAKTKKNLCKQELKKNNSKLTQNCNVSNVTDNVEFANEPFDNSRKNKCAHDNDKNKKNC